MAGVVEDLAPGGLGRGEGQVRSVGEMAMLLGLGGLDRGGAGAALARGRRAASSPPLLFCPLEHDERLRAISSIS